MRLNFSEMNIKDRLTASFRWVIGLVSITAVIAGIALFYTVNRYDFTLENYAFPQGDIGRLMNATAEVRSDTRAIIGYEEQSMIDYSVQQHEEHVKEVENWLAEVRPTMVTKEGKAAMEAVEGAWKAYLEKDAEVIALGATTDQELCIQAQHMAVDELRPLYDKLDEAIVHLMEINVEKGHAMQVRLEILSIVLVVAIVVFIIAAGIGAMTIATKIAKGISTPLKAMEERLITFAQGDLSTPFPTVDTKDEIASISEEMKVMAQKLQIIISDASRMLASMAEGNFMVDTEAGSEYVGEFSNLLLSMQAMNDDMSSTLRQVDDAAEQVSAGSTNLAEAAQALAEGATDQAASIEEMQATIVSVTDGIRKTASDVQDSYNQALKYAQEADVSREQMKAMMGSMERINETSQKIGNIISEIEDIASQTNLLSLNAAIEAARAGEAGKGFAVVADQIRNLAEQSAKSAVDTRELIEGSLREVNEGNEVAQRVAESIEEVVHGMKAIAERSEALSHMAADQAMAMEQAEQGIDRISEVVQANSATAQESSATSQELSAQATTMTALVGRFRIR